MKKQLIVLCAALSLAACGTTSGMKSVNVAPGQSAEDISPDFSKYNTVVVNNFTDGTKKQDLPEFAGKNFADRIAAAIKGTGAYENVLRASGGAPDASTIVVDGQITRYKEGNGALRLVVGFGAGSSYFDADVNFSDMASGKELGQIEVDKNSNPLGGGIAMAQTVDTFMKGASEKIAKELAEAKNGKGSGE